MKKRKTIFVEKIVNFFHYESNESLSNLIKAMVAYYNLFQ